MDALNIKIKGIRIKKGLKQEEVAEKIGMTQSNYARLESGKSDFKYERLAQIANVFELSVGALIDYDGLQGLPEDGKFYYTELQKKIKENEKLENQLRGCTENANTEFHEFFGDNEKLKTELKELKKKQKDIEYEINKEKQLRIEEVRNTKENYERLLEAKEKLIDEKERTIRTLEKLIDKS